MTGSAACPVDDLGRRVALVDGRSLTWYGPSLVTARSMLTAQLTATRP